MDADDQITVARQSIELPEVQEMVRRLSAYGLGVFVPHMHDEAGNMLPMPEGMVQVEGDDLRASFVPADQVMDTPDTGFAAVGWRWSETQATMQQVVHCPMVKVDGQWKHSGVRQTH